MVVRLPNSQQELYIAIALLVFGLTLATSGKMQSVELARYLMENGKDIVTEVKEHQRSRRKQEKSR